MFQAVIEILNFSHPKFDDEDTGVVSTVRGHYSQSTMLTWIFKEKVPRAFVISLGKELGWLAWSPDLSL